MGPNYANANSIIRTRKKGALIGSTNNRESLENSFPFCVTKAVSSCLDCVYQYLVVGVWHVTNSE